MADIIQESPSQQVSGPDPEIQTWEPHFWVDMAWPGLASWPTYTQVPVACWLSCPKRVVTSPGLYPFAFLLSISSYPFGIFTMEATVYLLQTL